ncbi:unnamed protein product [Cyclocybe aegerita]|uniref:Uncharacterized protein n=1 Tax=Cyclocybe aegerita TaxID=1973307 RepID=A0A8S0XPS9_CYCAE|nr:unnamed protein product [Cyclocybe aegerita]
MLHISLPRKYPKANRDVHTLDPKAYTIRRQKQITLTGSNPTIHVHLAADHQPVQLTYELSAQGRIPWPNNSRGFLYYFSPPDRPRIAGELRFRLTESDDPSTFGSGKDIRVSSTNEPWRRPLYSLAQNPHAQTRPLYDQLVEQELVPSALAAALDKLPKLSLMYTRCRILHTLDDPFPLDLAANWQSMVAISEEGVGQISLLKQFRDHRTMSAPLIVRYLVGVMLARFERSQSQPRSVVLRFLEEINPVVCVVPKYDEYIDKPHAGGLYTKHYHGTRRPWYLDIDDPRKGKLMAEGLRLLWDSTEATATGVEC